MDKETINSLTKLLKFHAAGLGIPSGAADSFINASIRSAKTNLKNKSIITELDLRHAVTKELRKYNRDLAYTYENYDIII